MTSKHFIADWLVHPAADLFPMMSGAEWDAFVDDVKANGIINHLIYWVDSDGVMWLIDGRNRAKAAEALKLKMPSKEWKGDDPVSWIISQNLHRRHLTPTQRSIVSQGVEGHFKKQAEARHREGSRKGGLSDVTTTPNKATQKLGEPSDRHDREAEAQAAKLLGISRETHRQGKKVVKDGVPGLVDMCRQGEVSVAVASEVSKLSAKEQEAIVEQGPKAVQQAAKATVATVVVDRCPVDCGSSICDCAYPKNGVRTQGGCRCEEQDLRRAVRYWRKRALAFK